MITEKQLVKFQKGVKEGLIHMGAMLTSEVGSTIYLRLDTSVGRLFISLHKSDIETKVVYQVFSKFEFPARAKVKFDCNKFSGKYNFHISDFIVRSAEEAVVLALNHFEETL